MNRIFKILALVGSLWAVPALAADNALIVTPGTGLTIRSVDVGAGVQAPGHALVNAAGTQIGVSGSPLFIQGAASAFASGSFLSGAFAAGSNVDLLTMRGTVAAGTAASNALLTGCIYNSSPITLTTGQGAAVQCSVNGYPTVVVSNTLTALTPGDGITTGTYASGSPVLGASLLWNSTTYDRWKSVATGVAAVGGTGTAGTAATNVLTVQGIASMTPFLSNPGTAANWGVGATGSAVPANSVYNGVLDASGGTNMLGLAGDPCQTSVKTTVLFTLATAAVKVAITGVSAKKIYVCQYYLNNNAADSVAIFEATTGTTCATAAAALIGSGTSVATAAQGNNWAANGGVSIGNGAAQVLSTLTNAADLCIAQSAATQLSGSFTYVTR